MYWTVLKYGTPLLIGILVGWTINGWRLDSKIYKLESGYAKTLAEVKTQALEKQKTLQNKADKIRAEQNAKIQNLQRSLSAALSGLQNRPSINQQGNTDSSSNGQVTKGCTGAELYRENAEDLIREAARADTIREGLNYCYQQYDSIRDILNNQKGK